jgi:hypothetical protein
MWPWLAAIDRSISPSFGSIESRSLQSALVFDRSRASVSVYLRRHFALRTRCTGLPLRAQCDRLKISGQASGVPSAVLRINRDRDHAQMHHSSKGTASDYIYVLMCACMS